MTYNYREGHWSVGVLDRTCGTDRGIFANPLMVSVDGYVYEHEVGFNYDSQSVYAESGPIDIGYGDRILSITSMVPDEKTLGDVKASFSTRFYPTGNQYSYGPYTLTNPTSIRITARQVAVKIEGNVLSDWRVGLIRFDAKLGGFR